MKIAIDCRYIGKSGIGRFCEGILEALDYDSNEYYFIGDKKNLGKYHATIVEDLTDPFSLQGLRSFDRSLNTLCDAYFTPNFLIPFGIRIPIHAVMHDLAFLDVKETTRGFRDKLIKKTLLKRCMKKATSIACVSEFTKRRCEEYYGKRAAKCYINYSGIANNLLAYAKAHPRIAKEDKIVFVGNVKPHKGISVLLEAFEKMRGDTVLRVIGAKGVFRTGAEFDEKALRNVVFTGHLTDEEMFYEIASAKYLVLPSKYEGFGLPPLEALCLGTQPIVSDLEVFHEVYDGLPVKYFHSVAELTELLQTSPDPVECLETIRERYNFAKCAQNLLKHL